MVSSVIDLCGLEDCGTAIMPIVQMCCDESGKWHNADWVVLGGLIGVPDVWNKYFMRDWRLKLQRHKVDYVHMIEAIHTKGDVFKRFRGHERERDELLLDFAESIPRGITPIVAAVQMPKQISARSAKQFHAFEGAIKSALKQLLDDESLSLICDEEDKHSVSTMYDLWQKYKMRHHSNRSKTAMIGFADDEVYPPLQAADMWAYTCFQLKMRNPGQDGIFTKLHEAITARRKKDDVWVRVG